MRPAVAAMILMALLAPLAASPQEIGELALPAVPATLRTPMTRATYIVEHFWDAMEFSDTLRSHNRDFMEQSFANYISLFPIADAAALAPAVRRLTARAQADAGSLSLLYEIAEKYLYETDSPVYNEEWYDFFAEAFLEAPMREHEKTRLRIQREMISKNRVGTQAADFVYEDRSGGRARLSETGRGKPLLLVFYDPDCFHCTEVMKELAGMERLLGMEESGGLAILAVYAGGEERDRELWLQTREKIPPSWTVGYNDGSIYTEDLYVLRNLPALYLLDASRHVMAKEPSPARLDELLEHLE